MSKQQKFKEYRLGDRQRFVPVVEAVPNLTFVDASQVRNDKCRQHS